MFSYMKKFFKVVPSKGSKPLCPTTDNTLSSQNAEPSKVSKEKSRCKEKECKGKKRKIGLDDDIFDTDAASGDCSETSASPVEEIVISDDDLDK